MACLTSSMVFSDKCNIAKRSLSSQRPVCHLSTLLHYRHIHINCTIIYLLPSKYKIYAYMIIRCLV